MSHRHYDEFGPRVGYATLEEAKSRCSVAYGMNAGEAFHCPTCGLYHVDRDSDRSSSSTYGIDTPTALALLTPIIASLE